MSTPRAVIDDIRREYGVDTPVPRANPFRQISENLIPLITDELYESRGHFLKELLQNADDNVYAAEVVPKLRIETRSDSIILFNNETGFQEEHVRALCSAGSSSKRNKKDDAIGEKGIGFKAVFQISNRPEIHSNGYHFCFDRDKHGKFGIVIPEWIDDATDSEGTRIVLPLKDTNQTFSSFFLEHLRPELLLFLRRLRQIEFSDVIEERSLILQRHDDGPTIEIGLSFIDNIEKEKCREERHRFRVHRKSVAMADLREDKRQGVLSTDVAVAFRLDDDGNVAKGPCRDLFAFLPVKRSHFHFSAHADFVLATSREAIRVDLPWNIRLRDSLGDCLAEAILECRSTSPPGATALRMLSDPKAALDSFLGPILERAITRLVDAECVPTSAGEWVRPEDAILTDADGLWQLVSEADARSLLARTYVKPDIKQIDKPLRLLGVEQFSMATLLRCINNKTWRESRAAAWFGELLARLGGARLDERQLHSLKHTPILRLVTGRTAAPAEERVYRSLSGPVEYGFETQLALLAPDVLSAIAEPQLKAARDLLECLGVVDATPKAVIDEHILPLHSRYPREQCSDDVLIAHAHYIRDHWHAYIDAHPKHEQDTVQRDLSAKLVVLSSAQQKDARYKRAGCLYLGTTYEDPHRLETLFGKLIADLCVSPEYLSRRCDDSTDAARDDWKQFFIKLGAHVLPPVRASDDRSDYEWPPEVLRLMQSSEHDAKLPFLMLIDKHWAESYSRYKDRPKSVPSRPSKMLLALQDMLVPTTTGTCRLGKAYLASDQNRAVFGDQVPLVATRLSTEFAAALGVIHAPTIPHAISRLDEVRDSVRDHSEIRSIVEPLYKFLDLHFDSGAPEIKEAFRTAERIVAEDGNWRTTERCCWTVPSKIRDVVGMAGLSGWWRDLPRFFRDKLGVADKPRPENLIDALATLAIAKRPTDETTHVAQQIYAGLCDAAKAVAEGDADPPEWLRRLRAERLIWTKRNHWVKCSPSVFAADDPKMEDLFAEADDVEFVHLPAEELTKHRPLLELLKIRALSDAIETGLPADVKSAPCAEFSERLKARLCAIARYLHHKCRMIDKPSDASEVRTSLSTIRGQQCQPLELEVTLHKTRVRHPFKAKLIKCEGQINLFLDASEGIHWDSVGIEIASLLGLKDSNISWIGTLLAKPSVSDVERWLETYRVPELPPDISKALSDDKGAEDADGQAAACAPFDEHPAATDSHPLYEAGARAESTEPTAIPDAQITSDPTRCSRDESDAATVPSAEGRPLPNGELADVTLCQATQAGDGDGELQPPEKQEPAAASNCEVHVEASAARGRRSGSGVQRSQGADRLASDGDRADIARRPPTTPDEPGRARNLGPEFWSTDEGMRIYVSRDRDLVDGREADISEEKRDRIQAEAIRIALEWERQQNRHPTDANLDNPHNAGYDILSCGLNGDVERYIEVKGLEGEWGPHRVAITPAQFAFAKEEADMAWLYVIEFALSGAPRIHRIQNFASKVWRFEFDAGWRDMAESAEQANWPVAVVGMRVRMSDGRPGSIVRVFGEGQNQGVEVGLDEGGKAIRVPWQPTRISVLLEKAT